MVGGGGAMPTMRLDDAMQFMTSSTGKTGPDRKGNEGVSKGHVRGQGRYFDRDVPSNDLTGGRRPTNQPSVAFWLGLGLLSGSLCTGGVPSLPNPPAPVAPAGESAR